MTVLMKKTLLFLSLFIGYFNASGQDIIVNPDPVSMTVNHTSFDEKVDFTLTNNTGENMEIYWSFEPVAGSPEEWLFFLCDFNLCYTPAVTSCPCSKPNFLSAGETGTFMMHINPNQVQGTGTVMLKILTVCDGTESISDIPITFTADDASSTEFEDLNNNITIYPNPTALTMSIKEDRDVKDIYIYNLVGKKVKAFQHNPGEAHDVSDLERGIYLVKMLNKEQNILKVSRLTKR